ncbi:hypothetical protein KY284_011136 [Solanum tuberosum]|nr:hypothetical protein KY284_011136 [Solanum tuberosum]
MARVVGPHHLAFGNLLTIIFKAFEVPWGEESGSATAPRATVPVVILLNDLHVAREQNATILAEIETLRTN